jgi:hypothetical protein
MRISVRDSILPGVLRASSDKKIAGGTLALPNSLHSIDPAIHFVSLKTAWF